MYSIVIRKSVQLISKDKEHRQRMTVFCVCSSDAQREHMIQFPVGILFLLTFCTAHCSTLLQSRSFVYLSES